MWWDSLKQAEAIRMVCVAISVRHFNQNVIQTAEVVVNKHHREVDMEISEILITTYEEQQVINICLLLNNMRYSTFDVRMRLHTVSNRIYLSGTLLFVTRALNPKDTAIYSINSYLTKRLFTFMGILL